MGLFSWMKGVFVDIFYDTRAEDKNIVKKGWYAGTSEAALFAYRMFLVRFILNEIQDVCAPHIKGIGEKFDSTYSEVMSYYNQLERIKESMDKIGEGFDKVGQGLGNLSGLKLNNIVSKLEAMGADVKDLKNVLKEFKEIQAKEAPDYLRLKERLEEAVEDAYATIEHPKDVPSIHFNVKEPFTNIFMDIFTIFLTGIWVWFAGWKNIKRRWKKVMTKRERRKAMDAMDPIVRKIIKKEVGRVEAEIQSLYSELDEVKRRLPAVNASIIILLEKSNRLSRLSLSLISRAGIQSGMGADTVVTLQAGRPITSGEIVQRITALSKSYDEAFEVLKDETRALEEACVRIPKDMASIINSSGRRIHDTLDEIEVVPANVTTSGPTEIGNVNPKTDEWEL